MKRLVFLTAVLLCLGTTQAHATEVGTQRQYGFGFQIGEPTALTAKAFVGGGNAFDFGLGFGGWGYGRCKDDKGNTYSCGNLASYISFHTDYLYQENILNKVNRLDWYAGIGGRAVVWGGNRDTESNLILIARVPVGLAVTFHRPDFLELYLELAPGLAVFPPLWFVIDFGLGVRAYF
jgi:hypothetical protein